MATHPVFIYDDGHLVVPEELRDSKYLRQGSRLELVSQQDGLMLRPATNSRSNSPEEILAAWESFPLLHRNWKSAEQQTEAALRKQRATERLDALYASKKATVSELKAAEREWEFADDALDFGITDR